MRERLRRAEGGAADGLTDTRTKQCSLNLSVTSARRRDVVPTLESAGQRRDTLVRGAEEHHAMGGHSSCRPRVETLYPSLSPTNELLFFLLFYYLKTVVLL